MAKFVKELGWMSNFYQIVVFIYTTDGKKRIPCNSVESAFHALRARNDSERWRISQMLPREAQKYAYNNREWMPPRADQLSVMEKLLRQKFKNPTLRRLLLECPDDQFVFETNWHDNYWGICTCNTNKCLGATKHNHLGKLLRKVKYDIIREEEQIKQLAKAQPAKAEVYGPVQQKELEGTDDLEQQLAQ